MCHYLGGGLHGRQKRVKAQSESSKSVVNSVLISREMPVFPGFLEIIRVVQVNSKRTLVFFCLSIKRMYLFRYMRARKIKIKNCQEYAIKTLTDKNICNIISNCDSMVKNTSPIAPVGYLNNIFFRKYLIVGRLL